MERKYESMMLIRNDLSEEDLNGVFNKFSKRIEELKGKVIEARIWAKERPLAFMLRSRDAEKKRFTKACYWLIDFELDTSQLADLKETIRLDESILRNIIIRKD